MRRPRPQPSPNSQPVNTSWKNIDPKAPGEPPPLMLGEASGEFFLHSPARRIGRKIKITTFTPLSFMVVFE